MEINTIKDYHAVLRSGPHAWPGGYPIFFVTADCAALCWDCGGRHYRKDVLEAIRYKLNDSGWRVCFAEVNWEDGNLHCHQCSTRIESAYAEPEGHDHAIT